MLHHKAREIKEEGEKKDDSRLEPVCFLPLQKKVREGGGERNFFLAALGIKKGGKEE